MIHRLILIILILASPAAGELKLAALFSDHAVLQAEMDLPVWGWADAGEKVTVRVGAHEASATANDQGKWMVKLPPMRASATPMELIVSSGSQHVTRSDILIGEVWIGSGQSNMAFAMSRTDDANEAIKAADKPLIRLFQVARKASEKPTDDVNGQWVLCSPETVKTFSATLYHFGMNVHENLKVPVGLIHSSWGGTPIQAWMANDPLASKASKPPATQPHLKPAYLYNGMIAPLIPYAIRGVTWYQGENNVNANDVEKYAQRMEAMVSSWREQWTSARSVEPRAGDWAFYYVQIAPYGKYRGAPDALPKMWEQQANALTLISNSGMAPTGDIGNLDDIHPKNKRDVGKRLALIALDKTYHRPDVVSDPPMYRSHTIDGGKVRVQFTGVGGGLVSRDKQPLTDFEIAGDDAMFRPAVATIDGADVVVSADDVPQPKMVRFAWRATATPNLANRAGLPAVAFRTR